jgi:hypothetical protein
MILNNIGVVQFTEIRSLDLPSDITFLRKLFLMGECISFESAWNLIVRSPPNNGVTTHAKCFVGVDDERLVYCIHLFTQ